MNDVKHTFKTWKIFLALIVVLFFIFLILKNTFSKPQFVNNTKGAYEWVDYNNNKLVDVNDANDFVYMGKGKGSYDKLYFQDFLSTIQVDASLMLNFTFAIMLIIGRDLFYIFRIKLLTDNELSLKSSFNVIMLWEFASAITPGVVGGSTVAMFILNKEKINLGKATSIIFLTAILDNLFFVILVITSLFLYNFDDLIGVEAHQSLTYMFILACSIIVVISLFLLLCVFFKPTLLRDFLLFFCKIPFLKKFKNNALKIGEDMIEAARIFGKKAYTFWLKAFSFTFISWLCRYLLINCIVLAFTNLKSSEHILLFFKQLVMWVLMLITPTPGGSGSAEFALREILSSFSVELFQVTLVIVIWRLLSYFPYLIIGFFILPKWLRKN